MSIKQVTHLASLLVLLICTSNTMAKENELVEVKIAPVEQWQEIDGYLEALQQGSVSAQTSGRVVALHYDVNDFVPKGAVILEITNKEQSARLRAAKALRTQAVAQNTEAQLQLQRYQDLFPKGAISKGQLDNAIANAQSAASSVRAAQAQIDEAKEALGYTLVKAPYAGIVSKRYVELGEMVTPGAILYSGMSLDKMRAVIELPQRYLKSIDSNTQFVITSPDGQKLISNDFTLFNYADASSHNFKLRINLPSNSESRLLPGMWVKTAFVSASKDAIVVPKSSVMRRSELSTVFVKLGEQYSLRQVRLGRESEGTYEILAGLREGESIALDAYAILAQMESVNE